MKAKRVVTMLLILTCWQAYAAVLKVPSEYATIALAFAAANYGDEVELADSQTPYSASDLVMPDGVILRGEGNDPEDAIISSSGSSSILLMYGTTATLKYLTISSGNSTSPYKAGGITVEDGTLTCVGVDFDSNHATDSGGAILASESMLLLEACRFSNNQVLNGNGGSIAATLTSLDIQNCDFIEERAMGDSSRGGALYSLEEDVEGLSKSIKNSRFIGCQTGVNGAGAQGGAIYMGGDEVLIEECVFEDNSATWQGGAMHLLAFNPTIVRCEFNSNLAGEVGGALYLDEQDNNGNTGMTQTLEACVFSLNRALTGGALFKQTSLHLLVSNCEFVGNMANGDTSEGGGALACDNHADVAIRNCLFHGNEAPSGSGSVLTLRFGSTVELTNVTMTRNGEAEATTGSVVYVNSQNNHVTGVNVNMANNNCAMPIYFTAIQQGMYNWSNMNVVNPGWGACDPDDMTGTSLMSVDHLFVDDEEDFRLKWNSPLMDAGHASSPPDFDLTRADIGWTPVYEEIEVSGTKTLTERGWYKLVGNTVFSGVDMVVPEGTTIRSDGEYTMGFCDTDDTNGYRIQVGDPAGARTAIVGSPTAGSIAFGSTSTAPRQAATTFDGVLFNRAPDFNGGALWFNYCDVDLNGAGGNVKFNGYDRTKIMFDYVCLGQFKNLDFMNPQIEDGGVGIGCVGIQYSDVDVIGITFDRVMYGDDPWYWKLMHYGTVPSPNHVIAGNHFEAQTNALSARPVALGGATLNLHHNTFNDIEAGAIGAGFATLNLKNGASNQFFKEYVPGFDTHPMIIGFDTYLDLECGNNSFVCDELTGNYQFITSTGGSSNWAYNYWGEDCENGVSPYGHIPNFVTTYSPWLEACPLVFMPCQGQGGENDLYAYGQEAAEIENHEAAVAYWIELLEDYPESKYCTEVTGIIKAIGLYTEYGAQDYPLIRTGLESAAEASEPVDDLLSISQVSSAWCVEAMHGDRPSAVALLDSLLIEKDGYAKAELLINTALAEIATYPAQGQMNALGPMAAFQRLEQRRLALQNLHRAMVPDLAVGTLPNPAPDVEKIMERPSIFGIMSCHPNPFNPTMLLELRVDGEEAVTLEIYNTLGQRVAVLHQGFLPAGTHTFQWTAGQVASGVYVARAVQGRQISVAKVVLVR
ncbi:MAG: T9SS type A sorting domain-containing protein [bacterium]|nr:T9SS type A sorting domain-containing protein [bacterium]